MNFSFADLSLANVEAATSFSTLPPGRHVVTVKKAEVGDTKDGSGKFIKLSMANSQGSIITRINVHNKNPEAVRIGKGELKALLVCGGHPDPDNIGQHGVQSMVGLTVGIVVGTETYQGEARSSVKGYISPAEVDTKAAASSGMNLPAVGSDQMPF